MKEAFSLLLWFRLGLLAASLLPPQCSRADGVALTIAQQGANVVISWPNSNPAFGLQYSPDLNATNWTTMTGVGVVSNTFVLTNQIDLSAKFYRLICPCGQIAPPTLGPVPSQNITTTRYITNSISDGTSVNVAPVDDFSFPVAIEGDATNVIDASAFVDPSGCVPGTLNYAWVVCYIQDDGTEVVPYSDVGITGYLKPVLTINPDAMPAGEGYLILTVTSSLHPDQSTQMRINIEIDTSTRAQISYYLQCQATDTLCPVRQPNCLCFLPVLLPTSEPTQ
jgi:hypothetical protein